MFNYCTTAMMLIEKKIPLSDSWWSNLIHMTNYSNQFYYWLEINNLTSVNNSSNCHWYMYMKVLPCLGLPGYLPHLAARAIHLQPCRPTSSTRPKPPTPSVARNERSFKPNSAISFGIFFETLPMATLDRFSDEAVTLWKTIKILQSQCNVS